MRSGHDGSSLELFTVWVEVEPRSCLITTFTHRQPLTCVLKWTLFAHKSSFSRRRQPLGGSHESDTQHPSSTPLPGAAMPVLCARPTFFESAQGKSMAPLM